MKLKRRGQSGQSMVEYALGIGCVAALCVVALGSLGHIAGDMVWKVEQATNYGGSKSSEPGRTVQVTGDAAKPWVID